MDVGARLKEARVAKGLSLESLQETTKIQKRYLIAIEEGNFHLLPGKFYARAFIKEYASAVGLDPDELLEEHKEEIPTSDGEGEIQYTRMERARRERSLERTGIFFSILPKIIVVLLVLGIIGAGVWFYKQADSPQEKVEIEDNDSNVIITNPDETGSTGSNENKDDEEEPTEEAEEPLEEEEEESVVTFEVDEITEGTPTVSTINLTNPSEELIFKFQSQGNVWLDVKNSEGEAFFSGFVTAESPVDVDLTGEERIHLNIGSTPNLDIEINDITFEYPVDPSEMDHQHIWFNVN